MPTMNVSLTEEMVKFEVVRDGLRVLRHERQARKAELRYLREEVQKGIDDEENGRFSDRSVREIFEQVLREHRRAQGRN